MAGLSNYPPGHPTGNLEREFTLRCENEECPENGETVSATYIYERDTGAAYLLPEGVELCPDCGQERRGA